MNEGEYIHTYPVPWGGVKVAGLRERKRERF
jgi:hypothetical protein